MKPFTAFALTTAFTLAYAACWRLKVVAVNVRLQRLDRLLETGRRREADRTMAAVKRDCARWFKRSGPVRAA